MHLSVDKVSVSSEMSAEHKSSDSFTAGVPNNFNTNTDMFAFQTCLAKDI